ncbi:multicopper oxidase domain-containing protein [Cellulomonas gilvus]|uniref:Copper-containing nitrite reductase n=1 Tax=Cellulomonas gilvus (strain ATCC 13127 / NRRL B-14078) TaxID=593907 RepID=F8A0Z0_CELGA|nr:multicopper oxidase domain-containing protein [Cellulomonas gilvus]AEI12748.1 Nitrite reductase (NO-forming) [Cellulomonas gilvus ATCC 13127]
MTRASWHLRANALVLAWLLAAATLTVAHRWVPAAQWLMVHLLLLGAVSSAILLWSQHFADTLLRQPAPGGRRGLTLRLAAHTVGALLVVAGLAVPAFALVVPGGVLVAGAGAAQAVVLLRQMRAALPGRFRPLVRWYVAAGAALPLGVAGGVVLARGTLSDELHGRLYVAHVTLTLIGWVAVTVLGTLMVLWPTVTHARIEPADEAAGRRALPVVLAGLAVVVIGTATGLRVLVPAGCVVVAVGAGLIGAMMWRQWRSAAPVVAANAARATPGRTAPVHVPPTFAPVALAASTAWLAGSLLAFGAVVAAAPGWDVAADRVRGLVAPFAVGFAAQVLLGALSHLLPVVLGGGPAVTRRTAAELDRGAVVRLVLVNGGLLLFCAPVPSAVRVVVSLVVLGALAAFLVLAARAVLIARRTAPAGPTAPVDEARPAVPQRPVRSGALAVGVGGLALAVVVGVAMDPPSAGIAASDVAGGVTATGRTTTVAVQAQDMRFSPARIEVPAGDRLVVEVTNVDDDVHDLVVANGATSGRLAPGESARVDVGVVGTDTDAWCSVAGHRLMGMTLEIAVTGEAPRTAQSADPSGAPTVGGHSGDHMGHGSASTPGVSAADRLDLMAEPDASFVARDAALPPLGPDDGPVTRHVRLEVQEVVREVAPGVTQRLWTFGGQAPGPVLHGRVGDTFVVTLVNDGSIGHSIDFHAGALAPDDVMRTIAPGQELTYRFTATRSGVWMYHCSTMPMSVHIANGMLGAVVIEPDGLAQADRQYVVVQHELYLGEQGGEVDAAKVAGQVPDLVVLNGYANQYRDRPLTAAVGERVRLWVLDAGPNRPSAFHVVGGQFDTVFREGDYTLRAGGSTGTGGAQVLALQPAEGGFVELTFPQAGTYPFVTHVMSDAEKGAMGRVRVTP